MQRCIGHTLLLIALLINHTYATREIRVSCTQLYVKNIEGLLKTFQNRGGFYNAFVPGELRILRLDIIHHCVILVTGLVLVHRQKPMHGILHIYVT